MNCCGFKKFNQSATVGSRGHRSPDWLIRSYLHSRRSDNLHKDSHQKSWLHPRVKLNHTIVNYNYVDLEV